MSFVTDSLVGDQTPMKKERKEDLTKVISTPVCGDYIEHLDILEKEYRIIPEFTNEYGRVVCITFPVCDEHHTDCPGCFGVNYGVLINIYQTRNGFFIQEFTCERETWYSTDDVSNIINLLPESTIYITIDPPQ